MKDDKFLRRFIVITGTSVSSIIALAIIIPISIFKMKEPDLVVPEVLVNWGGIILGFYFGSFTTLIRDLLGAPDEESGNVAGQSGIANSGG